MHFTSLRCTSRGSVKMKDVTQKRFYEKKYWFWKITPSLTLDSIYVLCCRQIVWMVEIWKVVETSMYCICDTYFFFVSIAHRKLFRFSYIIYLRFRLGMYDMITSNIQCLLLFTFIYLSMNVYLYVLFSLWHMSEHNNNLIQSK